MHGRVVLPRRVRKLAEHIAGLLPDVAVVMDLGCGDGKISRMIHHWKPGISLQGFDVLVRPDAAIPVHPFDGVHLPVKDNAMDGVLMVDVLHHTGSPMALLSEAERVARDFIIIKDHCAGRRHAERILWLMDWVGNRPHGVALPCTYWKEAQWRSAWSQFALQMDSFDTDLGLYPWPANLIFERGLHFLAKLSKASGQ